MYDKAGNISEVYENGLLTNRYTYDKLSRMVREDNKELGKTTVFAYDVGGNILSRSEYGFTLGSLAEKEPVSVMLYSYKANGWRDQMTSYNGEKCVYDDMGRPTTYRNKTLAWSRYGTLTNYNGNTYTYDANGIRLTKTVNGVTTKFYISGTKMLGIEIGTNKLRFRYGVAGIQGFSFNGQEYIYRKNIQGDITHIYKVNNDVLMLSAEYKYDAWGKCEVVKYANDSIGDINPIRYHGYYFDAETGLYYLNSRYYDPEVGRFISADDTQFLEPNTVNGLNLYSYCASNPVMNVDSSGKFFITFLITSIVVGVVIGGTVNAVKAAKAGADGLGIFGAFLGGAIMGGAMGAVMALGGAAGLASMGVGVVGFGLSTAAALSISLGIGIGAGMASYAIEHGMRSDLDFSLEGMVLAGVSGGFQAAATFGLAFLGGRAGLYNSSLGSQYNFSLGKMAHITSFDFMTHVISTTGSVSTVQAFVYAAQVLLGNTIPRLILVTGIGALLRWIIKKGVGEK